VNEVGVLVTHTDFVSKSLGVTLTIQDASAITEEMRVSRLPAPMNPVIVARPGV
jgi:hypothetical protein